MNDQLYANLFQITKEIDLPEQLSAQEITTWLEKSIEEIPPMSEGAPEKSYLTQKDGELIAASNVKISNLRFKLGALY